MKILILFFSLSSIAQAQDHFSLYFESNDVPGMEKKRNVDDRYFGEFKLVETESNVLRVAAGDILKVDESGIYIQKNRLLHISREEVRENSQYIVKDGWLFGVINDDSVQVALDGELYYFLMPVKTYLFEAMDDLSTLYSTGSLGQYLLMSEGDNEYYEPLMIELRAGGVFLKELDYQCESFDLRKVETAEELTEEERGSMFYIEPNEKEWKQILSCFVTYDSYSK